jgi:putative PIN family toxin of toxin-antitoxin system
VIVVVDTSVWISALQFSGKYGKPGQAIEKAAHHWTIATCVQIEDEILSTLTEKFGWKTEEASAVMAGWLPFPLRVTVPGVLRACRDPNDDMVLECAAVAVADYIVSGDKDLLALDPYNGIRIVRPSEFLALESQR